MSWSTTRGRVRTRLRQRRVALALACFACGCESRTERTHEAAPAASSVSAASASSPAAELAAPASSAVRGDWRFLPFDVLDRVVYWVAHIVVAHDQSRPFESGLRRVRYGIERETEPRTKDEARQLAERIALDAKRDPSQFAALARRFSDDPETRPFGGSFGGVHAGQLPTTFLDHLPHLAPGAVSAVIETSWGFHVLLRKGTPEPREVAGRRVILGYDGVMSTTERPPAKRSRSEALALANRIAGEARSGNRMFAELVAEHSDGTDAVQQGDMGVGNTSRPAYEGLILEVLAGLDVGAVSDPVDSPFGFQILLREPVEPREEFAMNALWVPFDAAAPASSESSKTTARSKAKELARTVRKEPSKMKELLDRYPWPAPRKWSRGGGPIGADAALAKLALGEIAAQPVQLGRTFAIVQRLDPATVEVPAPLYEMPASQGPDFEVLLRLTGGEHVAPHVRKLAEVAPAALRLQAPVAGELVRALELMADQMKAASTMDERARAYRDAQAEIRRALGPDEFQRFQGFVRQWGRDLILGQRTL